MTRKKDPVMEVYPSAIMDYGAKENHIINLEGVKFPARDTHWLTAKGVKEAVEIRKTGAHSMNRDEECNQLLKLVVAILKVVKNSRWPP